jgi:C-terminal processing protease CtpA/Prc
VPRELAQIEPFPRAEILPGNVACIEVRLFAPRERAEERAVEAMKTVADADAVIFDLRGCMGGSPDMVHLVTSYLYGPEPMHLLTYYHAYEEPDSAYTLAEVPGRRRPDIPAYVVTSGFTGSGGEEFTYNLKHHGRATVVGETTAGAGHGGGVHPVAAGFEAFVPDFRPVHPVTGGGWEGVGVKPDLEAAADHALDVAHREALREIVRRRPERSAALAEEIARLDERIERGPPSMDPNTLTDYAGVYDIRTIRVKDGGLTLQRTGGPELELVPATEPDHFTLKLIPTARIRFERDGTGAVTAVHVLNMQGQWETSPKGAGGAP